MQQDSRTTKLVMIIVFMGLVFTLAGLLFVMIAYGYGGTSGPGGLPTGQR